MEINMKGKKVREWCQFYRLKFKMGDSAEVSSVSTHGKNFPGSLDTTNRSLKGMRPLFTKPHAYISRQWLTINFWNKYLLFIHCVLGVLWGPHWVPLVYKYQAEHTLALGMTVYSLHNKAQTLTFMSTFIFDCTVSSGLKLNLVFYH